ncbi:hypothetical protein EG028_06985 [Chitinophaga barathri]|uniref:Peptidase S74 domain-containing protein n=2 Tax=Chitinophaga barathri TaxID=1647451 RepID=A0A3N4MPA6_9BACT|nr:hypothetical protein EG028_06985 [Chitinophaga barathri]
MISGSAFSQILNQFTSAQTAEAWVTGRLRANTSLESNAAPGLGGFHLLNNSGTLRWLIRGNNTEAGSNSGFDFVINRRNDAGISIDLPFSIARATGDITMPGIVNMGGNSTVASNLRIKGTASGITNGGGISFYELDNTTRVGYIGDAASGNSDIYITADVGGVTLTPANGVVSIYGNTSNMLLYRNVGMAAPSMTTRSLGTKAVWFPSVTATQADYATGIEDGNIWNSVAVSGTIYGFKWYGGTTQVARLDGVGNFETINSFRVGPATGSERLAAKSNALSFNRDVNTGAIFSATGHAYQFNHTSSTTPGSDRLDLLVYNTAGTIVSANAFSVNGSGNIGMGVNPQAAYKLSVNGTVGARKVKVTQETWADYVFKAGYKMPTIAETEAFIQANKHLPGIPSEKEIIKDGIDVGEMNKLLLQKIEEQMLYIIEMNKEMKELKKEVKELKDKKD